MSAMGCVSLPGYLPPMTRAPQRGKQGRAPAKSASALVYPNRIRELTKAKKTTYAQVADRVGAHEITIAKLATGKMELTHDWMKRLARAFDVSPAEIIERPIAAGLRRVRVRGTLKAGSFEESFEWPHDDQYDVMVRDDQTLRRAELYGGEVEGMSMNLRYPPGSVVIMSKGGSDLIPGRRYHVRLTRADGTAEDTIKTLERGQDGRYWLKPESSDPQYQAWIPLEGQPGETVELIGRVRFAYQRED